MLNDLVGVKIDESQNQYKEYAGIKFKMNTTYRDLATENAIQDGIVVSVPKAITQKTFHDGDIDFDLKVGERVFAHHHLNEFAPIKDGIRMIPYHLLYCKKSGDNIEMLNSWNFMEPIKSKSSSIMKFQKNEPQYAKVVHASKTLKDQGINEGDTVVYVKGMDSEIMVDGKIYYRTLTRHVQAKIEE